MKNLRRWPRVFLALIYLFLVLAIVFLIFKEFVSTDTSSMSNNDRGGVVLGLSLAVENPQTFLSNQGSGGAAAWSTSFLLQSQSPISRIYLDYVSVHNNVLEPTYCFVSFHVNKDPGIPYQIIYGLDDTSNLGRLESMANQPAEFTFSLFQPICIERGHQYFLPHIFLGIVPSETSAYILFDEIVGRRALEFFPFEKQVMDLDLSAHYLADGQEYSLLPNFDVTVSQPGWLGEFSTTPETTQLILMRPRFYQIAVVVFFFIMSALIIFLNNIVDDAGGFFEIAFGLLLGLWGTHEILIPNYIEASIPIDVVIYVLYALVISEMVAVSIDEYFVLTSKRKVRIIKIIARDLDQERVIIKNPSFFPVDMTGWLLFDQALNKYKFPVYVLPGKNLFSRVEKTVAVWTKAGMNDKFNLYWGRRQEVWNNDQETAFLEDAKGEAIDNCTYLETENT